MSFKDDNKYNRPFSHSNHKCAIKDCKVKRKYANSNAGQHVHFHDFMTTLVTNNLIQISHVKMKFVQINLLFLHIVRHSQNVNQPKVFEVVCPKLLYMQETEYLHAQRF